MEVDDVDNQNIQEIRRLTQRNWQLQIKKLLSKHKLLELKRKLILSKLNSYEKKIQERTKYE